MIDIEKLKIVLDLYKKGEIDYNKAYTLLSEPSTLHIQQPVDNPWTIPYIPYTPWYVPPVTYITSK